MSAEVKSWFKGQLKPPSPAYYEEFLIHPPSLCPPSVQLDYLLVVKSAVSHFRRRMTIRETFGQPHFFQYLTTRVVFLLGTAQAQEVQDEIMQEADLFQDVVQANFLDTYRNLTYKGLAGLSWVSQDCSNVDMIINIDDDVFLNVFKAMTYLPGKFQRNSRSILCFRNPAHTKPIERGESSVNKWPVDESLFPGLDKFPVTHCNGYFVAMSVQLVRPMLAAASVNPFFWIDDVYLYGLLPQTVGDVSFYNIWRYKTKEVGDAEKCLGRKGIRCNLLIICDNNYDRTDSSHFRQLWSLLTAGLTDQVWDRFYTSIQRQQLL